MSTSASTQCRGNGTTARSILGNLCRRWPTALAVALAVAGWGISESEGLAEALLLPAIGYPIMVLVHSRRFTWPVVLTATIAFIGLRSLGVDTRLVLMLIGCLALAVAAVSGRNRVEVARQGVGFAVVGVCVGLAVVVGTELAAWATAVGWIAHGLWDFWHLRRDAVVSRTFAEWCGVVDILIGAQLIQFACAQP